VTDSVICPILKKLHRAYPSIILRELALAIDKDDVWNHLTSRRLLLAKPQQFLDLQMPAICKSGKARPNSVSAACRSPRVPRKSSRRGWRNRSPISFLRGRMASVRFQLSHWSNSRNACGTSWICPGTHAYIAHVIQHWRILALRDWILSLCSGSLDTRQHYDDAEVRPSDAADDEGRIPEKGP